MTKPATKPTIKPATKSTTKPTTKPAIKPTTKPTTKPASKPEAKTRRKAKAEPAVPAQSEAKAEPTIPAQPEAKAKGRTRAKSTPKPSAASAPTLRLFQWHVGTPDLAQLDPAFEPLELKPDQSAYPEITLHARIQRDASLRENVLWGVLPAHFTEATGLSGTDLRNLIEANPGYDLYFCHPRPELEAVYHNLWLEGAGSYPDFALLAREFLKASGLGVELIEAVTPSRLFGSGQFIVATPQFWEAYLDFVQGTLTTANQKLNKTARAMLNTEWRSDEPGSAPATYLRLVLDRLFSTFLMLPGNEDWKALKYAVPVREPKLDVHLRLLREMKDLAIAQNSYWEAACWVNYRNLYLMQVQPREWLEQNLASVTPQTLRFGFPALAIDYPFPRTDQVFSKAAKTESEA